MLWATCLRSARSGGWPVRGTSQLCTIGALPALGIEDQIPDHYPVFSRARHERFRQSDALRRIFESVVAKCIAGWAWLAARDFRSDARA